MGGKDVENREQQRLSQKISRRRFVQLGGMTALGLIAGGLPALSGCRSEAGDRIFRGERTITDHAGRTMTVPTPKNIERIYGGHIYTFSLNPDIIAGSPYYFTKEELAYLPEGTGDLTVLGSMGGDVELDLELLMQMDIQIMFFITNLPITASDISIAKDFQEMTGIPSPIIDASFENIVAAYELLGDILGCEERAKRIGDYCANIYQKVTTALAPVKDEDRVSVYYAEGPFGLSTEPDTSNHALAFEVAKARNVAAAVPLLDAGYGMTGVSLESVIKWDPEVIIAWDDVIRGGADEIIRTNRDWSDIRAVKTGRVYTMPNAPFAWLDRPPSVNRFLGIQWVANMLYPDLYDVDMVEVVKEFYDMLYWVQITDEQALDLLGNSYPPYRGK
ncbi:MAG: ABC transporter substrate-binding protein [Coriobacteriales bacterium]|nr:ABC transporter substrate-binding protein [Coriobacteriales bacterium]